MNANKRSLFKYLIPLLIFLAFSVAFSYTQITPYLIKVSKIIDVDNPDYFIDLSAPDVSIKTAGGATFTGDVNISGNLTTQNYLCVGGDCVNSLSGLSGIPSGYCVEFYNASCPSGFKLFQNLTEAVKFGYKRKIIITDISHHDIFDYQINITLDTQSLISAGKMRSDCGDIRFYDENNNELSYWIEDGTCGTTQTHIWVKVPYIPASSSTTIYLYYGNPDATSKSDGQAVFEFFDDFNDGVLNTTKWVENTGTWTEENGVLKGSSSSSNVYIRSNYPLKTDGTEILETKTKLDSGDLGAVSIGGSTSGFSYNFFSNEDEYNNVFRIWDNSGYGDSSLPDGFAYNYHVIGTVKNLTEGKIHEYIDYSYNHYYSTSQSYSYYFSLCVWTGSGTSLGYFDWVLVRKYTNPEPSVSIGEEENQNTNMDLIKKLNSSKNFSMSFWCKPEVDWWNYSFPFRKQINITENSGSYLFNYQIGLNISYNPHMKTDFSDLRFAWKPENWWNNSFLYRRPILIKENSNSLLTDYQINITLDTTSLISSGKMRSDCNDIRFIYPWKYKLPITITEQSGKNLTNYQVQITLDTASLISAGKMRSDCGDIRFFGSKPLQWKYKLPITITEQSGQDLTDYQVQITLDTASLISSGKMRSDCGDIRFYDENNNELPYWIEDGTCNSANTKIWVKVPYIPASSSTTIYLYYGNPDATSHSNITSTFIFGDDFNDGAIDTIKWGIGGSPTEENGYLKLYDSSSREYLCSKNSFGDGILVRVKMQTPGSQYVAAAGLVDDYAQDAGGAGATEIYETGGNWNYRINDGSTSYGSTEPEDDDWHIFEITRLSNYYKIFRDGTVKIEHSGITSGMYLTLTKRAESDSSHIQIVDYAFIKKYTNPEPSVSIGEEENIEKLPYWIEDGTCNSANTKIWVKVPYIPANGQTTIYMLYGNPDATSESNATQVFVDVIEDLMGSWNFDEGSGTIAHDNSGNNNDGTLVNGPVWTTGKFGNAVELDGSNDYILIPDSPIYDNNGKITLEAWVKPTSSDLDNNPHRFISTQDTVAWDLRVYQNKFQVGFRDSASHLKEVFGTTTVSADTWYHVVGILDGTIVKIYVNGIMENSDTFSPTGNFNPTDDITLGCLDKSQEWFSGVIDEVRIYKKALTSKDVNALYNNKAEILESNKVFVRKYTSSEPTISIGEEENIEKLPYWIEDGTCNSANTKIWVKVPYIPANGQTIIWLYYGNPSAESQSDGQAVFEFFDDFNDGVLNTTKWNPVKDSDTAEYVEENGLLKIHSYGSSNQWNGVTFYSKRTFNEPLIAESKFTPEQSVYHIELRLNGSSSSISNFWARTGAIGYDCGTQLGTSWYTGSGYYDCYGINVQGNYFRKYKLELTASTQKAYLDDVLKATRSFDLTDGVFTLSLRGAYNYYQTADQWYFFDWVFVRKYASVEPTISIDEEQQNKYTVLPYWIEEKVDSSWAKVWVKVPYIPASSSTTIYLYYGNPDAIDESNPKETMLFYEDFNDNSKDSKWIDVWWDTDCADWVEQNGRFECVSGRGCQAYYNLSIMPPFVVKMHRYSATEGTYYQASLYVSNNYSSGRCGDHDYCVQNIYANWGDSQMHSIIFKDRGVSLGIKYLSPSSLGETEFYLYVFFEGSKVKVEGDINGENYYYNSSIDFLRPYYISLYCNRDGGNCYYDNVIARKYILPEPTITLGEEETFSKTIDIPERFSISVYKNFVCVQINQSYMKCVEKDLSGWSHIVFTFDSSNHGKLYINGILEYSFTFPYNLNNVTKIEIGKEWKGHLDDLSIYNRTLSDCEIKYISFSTYPLGEKYVLENSHVRYEFPKIDTIQNISLIQTIQLIEIKDNDKYIIPEKSELLANDREDTRIEEGYTSITGTGSNLPESSVIYHITSRNYKISFTLRSNADFLLIDVSK